MKMFRNRKYHLLDLVEIQRRLRRQFEGNINYRKLILILFLSAVIFLYIGPYIFSWLFGSSSKSIHLISRCMDDRLTPFYSKAFEFNAHIQHITDSTGHSTLRNIPYVGNGYFGIEIDKTASFYVKYGRHLSQPINYQPIVDFRYFDSGDSSTDEPNGKQSIVVDYFNGVAHKFQCFGNDFFISSDFYAHRVVPHAFVQEVKLTNTRNTAFSVDVQSFGPSTKWSSSETKYIKLKQPSTEKSIEFSVTNGFVDLPKKGEKLTVTIVSQRLPTKIVLKTRGITKLDIIHVIHYSTVSESQSKQKDANESAAIATMTQLLQQNNFNLIENSDASNNSPTNKFQTQTKFKRQHTSVWKDIWETGFEISTSLADNVINGDQINATIYAVLSQVRSFESEAGSSEQFRKEILKSLAYAEGCYDSYHTLQAGNLWKDMSDIQEMNKVVNSWLLTLEKQGCHNLIKAGASGVLQAMVLSFGGFRFSNQHLELNIHPKFLHRDYFFRRLNYGNMTHINVSIEVTEDNHAMIYVALDRSDGVYYACDGGCLDEPVPLSQDRKVFPVKLTEPLTAILYITQDKEHIEELRHAIHVKEVAEAPAHEHHVIALHKHGHQLGGLPTFFWVSIFVIIIVFHIFLCKLIIKEYCESPDAFRRYRYDKP